MRDCRIVLPCAAIFGLLLAACGGGTSASPLGTSVAVAYTDDTTNVTTDLEVTVLGVRHGTVAELVASGLQFDDDEQDLVPFYVDARYTNTGSETVGRGMRVALEDEALPPPIGCSLFELSDSAEAQQESAAVPFLRLE